MFFFEFFVQLFCYYIALSIYPELRFVQNGIQPFEPKIAQRYYFILIYANFFVKKSTKKTKMTKKW